MIIFKHLRSTIIAVLSIALTILVWQDFGTSGLVTRRCSENQAENGIAQQVSLQESPKDSIPEIAAQANASHSLGKDEPSSPPGQLATASRSKEQTSLTPHDEKSSETSSDLLSVPEAPFHEDSLSRFSPMIVRECTPTMPNYYAPCMARTLDHAVMGEELVYPGFITSKPIFAPSRTADSEKWWNMSLKSTRDRARRQDDSYYYEEVHG